jgi:hypothetical protein
VDVQFRQAFGHPPPLVLTAGGGAAGIWLRQAAGSRGGVPPQIA